MNLGKLIDRLESLPGDLHLYIAAPIYLMPTRVMSYRGYYKDLAIDFTDKDEKVTVGSFLPTLKAAVGETYSGYKGGEYFMDRDSRVWISRYGCASGAEVSGVEHDKYTAWITFTMEKW